MAFHFTAGALAAVNPYSCSIAASREVRALLAHFSRDWYFFLLLLVSLMVRVSSAYRFCL
jgi:hypothetical protein